MRPTSLALTVLVATTALGCNEPIVCGIFEWDPDRNRCVCPGDSIELADGSCMLADGGVVFPPGTERDAGVDSGHSADAGSVDASFDATTTDDACTARTQYADLDEDGFGDPAAPITACVPPPGTVDNADDCDDDCTTCHPGGSEVCNDRDDDCDGIADADEDTLCAFGEGCIDASCRGIPIYTWSAAFQPRTGGSVSSVLVESSTSGNVVAVVGYRGLVDVGAHTLPAASDASAVALVAFGSAGEVLSVHEIGRAADPHGIGATDVAVDDAGNMYVAGIFRGGATVQGRGMASSLPTSFVTRIPASGADWARSYPGVRFVDIEARADGFVGCGTFTGTVSGTEGSVTADAGGDALVMLGRADGVVGQLLAVSAAGSVGCTGLAARDGVSIATGYYSGDVSRVGASELPVPAATDVWALAVRDGGTIVWTSSGGSPYDDSAGKPVMSSTGEFVAGAFMLENTFAGIALHDEPSLALFRYAMSGETPSVLHSPCSAVDDTPALDVAAATGTGGGAPVLGVNLRWNLSPTYVRFGSGRAEGSGSTEAVLLGYSRGGDAPRWLLQLFGGGSAEEVQSVAAAGRSHLAVGGFFESTIRVAPTVTLAGTNSANGFVAVYRVR